MAAHISLAEGEYIITSSPISDPGLHLALDMGAFRHLLPWVLRPHLSLLL